MRWKSVGFHLFPLFPFLPKRTLTNFSRTMTSTCTDTSSPPIVLDRSMFNQRLDLVAVNVPANLCTAYLTKMKAYLLQIPRIKRVYLPLGEEDGNEKGRVKGKGKRGKKGKVEKVEEEVEVEVNEEMQTDAKADPRRLILLAPVPSSTSSSSSSTTSTSINSANEVNEVSTANGTETEKEKEEVSTRIHAALAHLPPDLQSYLHTTGGRLEPFSLHLTYTHLTVEQVLSRLMLAVLPAGTEIPSAFEQVGHIAHFNLRDHMLPFKHIVGQVVLDKNPAIKTVINKIGTIETEYRTFPLEVHIYTYLYTYTYLHTPICIPKHTPIYIPKHTPIYIPIHIHPSTYTYEHAPIYIRTPIYIHSYSPPTFTKHPLHNSLSHSLSLSPFQCVSLFLSLSLSISLHLFISFD